MLGPYKGGPREFGIGVDTAALLLPAGGESAGKRGSAKTRKGSTWLRIALMESARRAAG